MYLANIVLSLDQLVNTVLSGEPDETISARAYRNRLKKKRWAITYRVLNSIFFWQTDHCKTAWQNEVDRMHLSSTYRNKE